MSGGNNREVELPQASAPFLPPLTTIADFMTSNVFINNGAVYSGSDRSVNSNGSGNRQVEEISDRQAPSAQSAPSAVISRTLTYSPSPDFQNSSSNNNGSVNMRVEETSDRQAPSAQLAPSAPISRTVTYSPSPDFQLSSSNSNSNG